jgi:hypothetical protein
LPGFFELSKLPSRLQAILAKTTAEQTEQKVRQDLAAMEQWLAGAQDHANRQAYDHQNIALSHHVRL